MASFERFSELPTELRIVIWKYYYHSPRIHILQPVENAGSNAGVISATCTSIDAFTRRTNQGCLQLDINRESRNVALSSQSHNRESGLCEPVFSEALFNLRWQEPARSHAEQSSTVDIDWSSDLLYIYSPGSAYLFMSLARRPWAVKVERLAISVPWATHAKQGQRSFQFNGELLRRALTALTGLKEIWVVLPSQQGVPTSSAVTPFFQQSSEANRLRRDSFGFVELSHYTKLNGMDLGMENYADASRIFLALKKEFEAEGRIHQVRIKKSVDVSMSPVRIREMPK